MSGRGVARGGYSRPQDDPPGTSRLFIAVPVADDVRQAVGRLMVEVAGRPIDERGFGQPRWVRAEGLHLTLRFLGATPDGRQADLRGAMAAACRDVAPFAATLAGAGAFPGPQRPRVLWLGMSAGAAELEALSGSLDGVLAPLGWPPEERPFRAHLTIARTDGVPGAGEVAGRLVAAARDLSLTWRADRLALYKSYLGHGPARYEEVAAVSFQGG
jgi:2'-5' RNA ligase